MYLIIGVNSFYYRHYRGVIYKQYSIKNVYLRHKKHKPV